MEKGMPLKKSQFNYFTQNDNGDMILFNFAKGISSFCKIQAEDIDK